MAELTAFSYRPGVCRLHALDVRFKLVFLILVTLASLKAGPPALCVLTVTLLVTLGRIRLPLHSTLKEIRYVFLLLLLVFVARALSTPGSPVFEYKELAVSREGLHDAAVICWRLVIVILTGLAFIVTTRPSQIKAAVEWFFRPFPFIPGQRIATMMSLIMRFVPVILNQARETADAQRARGVENRKNPVYRLMKFAIPLVRRTFEDADKLAVAMEARCYSENRTDPGLSSDRNDWIALGVVLCLCILTTQI